MTQPDRNNPNPVRPLSARIGGALGLLLAVGLLFVAPASAAYEQVGTFAGTPGAFRPQGDNSWPQEVQLGGAGGMAVNLNGAGGVPPGTVYAAGFAGNGPLISRYTPSNGGLKFSEAWPVRSAAGEKYQRCGPDGEPSHPSCSPSASERPSAVDVDVDQTTGNVYVFNGEAASAGFKLVTVFSPDGSTEITRFGQGATANETTAKSPDKIHSSAYPGGIAVDATGNVYVFDVNTPDNFYHRLMVFKPQSPGDYEHYVYAGLEHDVAAGFIGQSRYPTEPVIDSAGDIYVAGDESIQKLDPSQPSAPPLCEFKFSKGGIQGMTVNPQSGEVFFFTSNDHRVHQLSPCGGAGGFSELGTPVLSPPRIRVSAMAVDPARQLASRDPGVLYAASPTGEGGATKGTPPNQEVESALGYIFATPKELAPRVLSESVSGVTSSSARLEGQVNPQGSAARYAFQYLTDAAYQANEPAERFAGAAQAPLGGGLLEGSLALPLGDVISGLLSDTEYHYRVLATSHCSSAEPGKVCTGAGAAKAFRTYPQLTPGLPDGRAFELVSPALKNGGQVIPAEPEVSSCTEIECKPGAAYNHAFPRQASLDGDALAYEGTPFSFNEGALVENEYVSRRTASGWQTTDLTPRSLFSKTGGGGYKAFDPQLSEGLLGQTDPSLSSDAPLEYSNLYRQPTSDPQALGPLLTEANAFLHRASGNGAGSLQLHYAGASTDLSRVFFEANDSLTSEADEGSETNLYEWSEGQLHLINLAPGDTEALPGARFGSSLFLDGTNAISKDGSHAFWSSKAGRLYVRIDGAETIEVKDPGKFLTAASDGSKVLLDDGCLYDLETEACEDLTGGKGGFQGIAGQSEDLSHVYFVDTAALAPGAEARSCKEAPGEQQHEEELEGKVPPGFGCSLYSWDEGTSTFIATLFSSDNKESLGDWRLIPSFHTAEASPAGRYLAFISRVPLVGYDNTGPCSFEAQPLPGRYVDYLCTEVYLYDSSSEELSCPSCPPSGAPSLGQSVLRRMDPQQPRYLTDSGRLYFDTQNALTPFDTNGKVEDVYQYEPNEVGSCSRIDGCSSLISSGRGSSDSNFLAIDPTAKNVFFTSRDQLNKPDQDQAIDVYDAREGGVPLTEPEALECQGEACQPPAAPPNDPTPGSSSFEGSGNVIEKKAAKKHKKHAKKHKKHGKKRRGRSASRANHNRGGAK